MAQHGTAQHSTAACSWHKGEGEGGDLRVEHHPFVKGWQYWDAVRLLVLPEGAHCQHVLLLFPAPQHTLRILSAVRLALEKNCILT